MTLTCAESVDAAVTAKGFEAGSYSARVMRSCGDSGALVDEGVGYFPPHPRQDGSRLFTMLEVVGNARGCSPCRPRTLCRLLSLETGLD